MRKNGNTTRIIDEAVQTLFTKGEVTIVDHYGTEIASTNAFYRFLDRLEAEHFRGMMNEYLEIDRKKRTVKLKK